MLRDHGACLFLEIDSQQVGGWVGGLDRGGRGGWNELLLWVSGGWVGRIEEDEAVGMSCCCGSLVGRWIGGWVGGWDVPRSEDDFVGGDAVLGQAYHKGHLYICMYVCE